MPKPQAAPRRRSDRVVELEWGDPPAQIPKAVQPYLAVLAELEHKPEHWARIATYASLTGAGSAEKRLRRELSGLDLGSFEFTARSSTEGSELYARFLGAS